MGRVFRFGNVGVYVYCEPNHNHHLPHAHVRRKGECLGTFFLPTLEPVAAPSTDLPAGVVGAMAERMEDLMKEWQKLNGEEEV